MEQGTPFGVPGEIPLTIPQEIVRRSDAAFREACDIATRLDRFIVETVELTEAAHALVDEHDDERIEEAMKRSGAGALWSAGRVMLAWLHERLIYGLPCESVAAVTPGEFERFCQGGAAEYRESAA